MRSLTRWLPWLIAAAAIALMVTLALQKRALNDQIREHRRADRRAQVADYIPTFEGTSTEGDSIRIGARHQVNGRQVVFMLTAACPFCRQSLPAWRTIAGALNTDRVADVEVIAVTTDSLSVATEYATTQRLNFPLVSFPSRKLAALSRAHTVPQTLVLDADGRVLFARSGVIESVAAVDSVIAAARRPRGQRPRGAADAPRSP